jgi:oligopeptidase B
MNITYKINQRIILFVAVFALLLSSCTQQDRKKDLKPPVAEKIKKELTIHGDTRIDNYYWMRLSDAQKNAEAPDEQTQKVLDYLNAENDYKTAMLKHTEDLQEKLFQEIVGRIKQDDESVPFKENGYFYYTRYEEGNEYPIYCRKKESLEAKEEIMLDVNELAEGYSKILAYGVDTVSRRRYTVMFKRLDTGEMLMDQIPNTTGGVTWANDNKTVFFSRKNRETLRSERIMKHVLGTNYRDDKEVFFEEDETFSCYVFKTKSKKYLMIGSSQTLSTEYRYLDANDPNGEFKGQTWMEQRILN